MSSATGENGRQGDGEQRRRESVIPGCYEACNDIRVERPSDDVVRDVLKLSEREPEEQHDPKNSDAYCQLLQKERPALIPQGNLADNVVDSVPQLTFGHMNEPTRWGLRGVQYADVRFA